MPYRRLPNTDNARIKALRIALEKHNSLFAENIISIDIRKTELLLRSFENAQLHYKASLEVQVTANRKFQKYVKSARLYVSHFIQVLNFSVIRNEIKKEYKKLYQLEPDNFAVPDLTSYDSLLHWCENVIQGEQDRLAQGGAPIYNPSIARVNVAFSQFREAYFSQKTHQSTTVRQLEELSKQRVEVDDTLTVIWNQIEAGFAHLPDKEKIARCKDYGVVYYLRKEEREALENEDN